MPYTPPALNAVNFALQAYTVPALNNVNFDFDPAAPGAASQGALLLATQMAGVSVQTNA